MSAQFEKQKRAVARGVEARKVGALLNANPYDPRAMGSLAFYWESGWKQADKAITEETKR